jgi:hypothetical protein
MNAIAVPAAEIFVVGGLVDQGEMIFSAAPGPGGVIEAPQIDAAAVL